MRAMISSITTRLALLYAAAALGTVVATSVTLFLGLKFNLGRDEAEALQRTIDEMGDLLADPAGNAALLASAVEPARNGRPEAKSLYVRVRDASGAIVYETTGMDARFPADSFAGPLSNGQSIRFATRDGRPYLLDAAASPGSSHGTRQAAFTIEAAMNLKKDDHLIAKYRNEMVVVLLLGSALVAIGAVLLTRRELRPLREIAVAVRRIRAEQLHERLGQRHWPMELADLASEFDQMLDRLEDSFNRLKQFSADLAHELRTPVHSMMGQTEVALSKARCIDEYRKVLESNLEESSRLAKLIDDLLFLARADNAQTAIDRHDIDAARVVDGVLAFFEAMALEKHVALTRSGNVTLSADERLLRRAISNLVSNALRHSKPGSGVLVRVNPREDGHATIDVVDEGCGIPADERAHVFDRFYRGETVRHLHDGGAGLGLPIVRSIMSLHGGTIEIDSTPGAGTNVRLAFPDGQPVVS